ncbi:MAG: methyl-accepting chemotaxis protein [Spirochaetales bacterium]|nr:methyl-accepting chemotaxis protein [Spirochaetales bacterium]
MNVRSKLSFVSVSAIIAFPLMIGLSLYSDARLRALDNLQRDGLYGYAMIARLSSDLNELASTSSMDNTRRTWQANRQEASEVIVGFLTSPLLAELVSGSPEADQLSSFANMWELGNQRMDEIEAALAAYEEDHGALRTGVLITMSTRDAAALFDINAQINQAKTRFTQVFSESLLDLIGRVEESIAAEQRRITTLFIVVAVAIALISLLIGSVVAGNLAKRIQSIESVMKLVSDRDFSIRLSTRSKDELGTLSDHIDNTLDSLDAVFERMKSVAQDSLAMKEVTAQSIGDANTSLSEISAGIRSIKEQFEDLDDNISASSTAVTEISQTIGSLNDMISAQSAAIVQSSASTEEMVGTIRNITGIATGRAEAAQSVAAVVGDGRKHTDEANRQIATAAENAREIHRVVEIIDSVAAQTNLLAMNAAIEAAHAGQHGAGFSVVAQEIRGLAESTTGNAKKIRTLLNTTMGFIVKAADASAQNIESFQSIQDEVDEFTGAFVEVSNSMVEMATNSDEVLKSISQLSDITHQISSSAGEIKLGISDIQKAETNIVEISGEVLERVRGIDTGAERVTGKTQEVYTQQQHNGRTIEELNNEILRFKTS